MSEISSNDGSGNNNNNNVSKMAQKLVKEYWSSDDEEPVADGKVDDEPVADGKTDDMGDISWHVRGITVKTIDNASDCQVWINKLLSNKPRLLGLDCEWKALGNNYNRGRVALLQICDDSICLLLKMINIVKSGNFPCNLIQLLGNPNIIKVGLSIAGDKEKLFSDYEIEVNGCVDIKKFVLTKCLFVETLTDEEKKNISKSNLERICNFMLGYKALTKKKDITMSNWELNPLSQSQIVYGASDAIYGYYAFLQCILNVSNSKIDYSLVSQNEISKIVPLGASCVDNIDIVKLCDGVVQVNYKKQMQEVEQVCCFVILFFGDE